MKAPPLALTHVVSYASRASVLTECHGNLDRPAATSSPLIVGDPAFDASAHPGLHRLPGSVLEATAVADALEASSDDVLIGPAATEAAVSASLEVCDLLHLSSHRQLDELSPFASSLILADRYELTVADIAGLRSDADLAVLTGCDTGRGNATLGGEIVGLTRSLLRSGIERAVVSLWPVDDAVAPVVMKHFYASLASGLPPADALANAHRAVYSMDCDDLCNSYTEMGGDPDVFRSRRRRAFNDDAGIQDSEEISPGLSGDAERFWAPFILVD